MFVKVEYFGFYPLGSDIELNHIKIMKSKWNVYKKPVVTYGKKNVVSPSLQDLYYVVSDENVVFFVAIEYGLGHYHIFTVCEKTNSKLSKNLGEVQAYHPMAVYINKAGDGVRIYGRVALGARDMNFKVDDSFFKMISQETHKEYKRYIFTNNGDDRFFLDVYNPQMVETSERFIAIGKAEKVVWHWESPEVGLIVQEYRLLDTYVEVVRTCFDEKEVLYFH